jgi:hypothetical protein
MLMATRKLIVEEEQEELSSYWKTAGHTWP